ncbi:MULTISPECIES: hypothetical protein [Legionella]|uniref:Uncharacterized protein n=1 Tax=Legionella drozanskii LLAP-1 TaxID=1212489 RepID=A0A0W0T889_9GAMM|nr:MULTISPECIES: hypothetical protein [Legionella]KTC91803.1 hypothetical protein Ldro_0637 [Legionella drozanskii LLAP-1]PJE17982.1 MAG: hypothetical protein CK430_01050 [Legionella sp.]
MPTPTQYRGRFFSEANYSSMAKSIANNKSLILELIEQITLFKSAFVEQLKQSSPKESKELEAAIQRSDSRLQTLKNLEANRPVTEQEQKLLVDYIKTMHISGAKVFADLHKDTAVEEKSSSPAPK